MPASDDQVLRLLQSTHRSYSVSQIANRCRLSRAETIRRLRGLQERGLTRESNRRWRATRFSHAPSKEESGEGPGSSEYSPRDDHAINPKSRWLGFRRLCAYYADCVRLEERPKLVAYARDGNPDFMEINSHIDWRALAAESSIPLATRPDEVDLLHRFVKRNPLGTVYLGGPIELYLGSSSDGSSYTSLTPIFVQRHAISRRDDGTVQLRPQGPIEINHGWMSGRIRDRKRRAELIDAIGLAPEAGDTEDEDAAWLISSFTDAVRRLHSALPGESFVEYPDPENRPKSPPLSEATRSGIYNRAVIFAHPKMQYAQKLHDELLQLATKVSDEELDQTALAGLFPHGEPAGRSTEIPAETYDGFVTEYALLSDQQLAACRSALRSRITLVTGPPGTGKSLTVAHVLANCALNGQKAVFASRNHQAIEAVEPRLNAMAEPEVLMIRASRARNDDGGRFQWAKSLSQLLAKPSDPDALDRYMAENERLRTSLGKTRDLEAQLEDAARLRIRLAELRAALRDHLADRSESWTDAAIARDGLPATEDLRSLRARLCIIDQPAEGLVRRLHRMVASVFHRRRVARDFAAMTAFVRRDDPLPAEHADRLEFVERAIDVRALIETARELRAAESALRDGPAQSELRERAADAREEQASRTRDALLACAKSLTAGVPDHLRTDFATIRAALHNRGESVLSDNDAIARQLQKAVKSLFDHYPLWAVTNLSVQKVSPLVPGIFDLAVIDEASQCDIASVLPILFRSKRSLVVGDPNQLSHVTSMQADTELRVRQRHRVDALDFERFTFRANSFFDLVNGSPKREAITLIDHYRCDPGIIGYCNATFYADALRVRSSAGRGAGGPRGCVWTHVEDDATPASSGCTSANHVRAVLEELTRLWETEYAGSVGVVTPFRKHADRLRDAIHTGLPQEAIRSWNLSVATADGFQGDERDLILFSLVGGPRAPAGSMAFLAGERNRFNVAVSRAKQTLHVLGDRGWASTCAIPHVRGLLQHIEKREGLATEPVRSDLIGPVWEPKLAAALTEAGIDFSQQYPACGYYLDFAVLREGLKLAVEVDGEAFHRDASGLRRLDDIYRDQVLGSAGWDVMRFWVYELRESLDECVERIRQRISC
jgi:very-short-patch-repair endonuclease/RecA/RadA recombinase